MREDTPPSGFRTFIMSQLVWTHYRQVLFVFALNKPSCGVKMELYQRKWWWELHFKYQSPMYTQPQPNCHPIFSLHNGGSDFLVFGSTGNEERRCLRKRIMSSFSVLGPLCKALESQNDFPLKWVTRVNKEKTTTTTMVHWATFPSSKPEPARQKDSVLFNEQPPTPTDRWIFLSW